MELDNIHGVGAATIAKLNKLSIITVDGLIDYLPNTYCDYDSAGKVDNVAVGDNILLSGRIGDVSADIRKKYVKAKIYGECEVSLIWFNQQYLINTLKDGEYCVYGKLERYKGSYSIANPQIERVDKLKNLKGIQPIYRLSGVLSQSVFKKIVSGALELVKSRSVSGLDVDKAVRQVHFPVKQSDIVDGHKVLLLERLTREFIDYKQKSYITNSYTKPPKTADISRYFPLLPYELTESQRRSVGDIVADMGATSVMNRLVLGDVGSGKSVVAMLAMLHAMESGYQSVMVAPTEILARQHYDNFIKLFTYLGGMAVFLSGKMSIQDKQNSTKLIENGSGKFIFATHAALVNNIDYDRLGLLVVDEVQKFGVAQKATLPARYCDVDRLVMSATPLPRTLSMVAYGDLTISRIYPRDSTIPITTYVMNCDKIEQLYSYIASKIAVGQQGYIVCPRLESSDGMELLSAKTIYNELSSVQLSSCRLGLVYGSMKEEEKSDVMRRFARHEIDVLIATSVIEVGIDNRNATIIAVLGANHFGLSTLHQLRGRVGRGDIASEAFFVSDCVTIPDRLIMLRGSSSGEELAVYDAEQRGVGTIFGINQSGSSEYERYRIKLTNELVSQAKELADRAISNGDIITDNDTHFSNNAFSIVLN